MKEKIESFVSFVSFFGPSALFCVCFLALIVGTK